MDIVDASKSESTSGPRRRGRPFRSHPGPELTREAVLEAALALTQREELSALTIQRVARAIDVSRTPVYGHFANADELRLGVLDHLLERESDAAAVDPTRWEDWISVHTRRLFDVLDTYPGVAGELFRTGFPDTDAGRRIAEGFVEALRAGGFSGAQTPSLILAIVAVAAGSVLQIHGAQRREAQVSAPEEDTAIERRRGTTLPPTQLGKEHFEQALAFLLAGMRASTG